MVSSECLLLGAKKVEGGGCKIGTVGRMRENSSPHCCSCVPCAQAGVLSDAVKQEALIHLPVLSIILITLKISDLLQLWHPYLTCCLDLHESISDWRCPQ